jgi:hypothetical protein
VTRRRARRRHVRPAEITALVVGGLVLLTLAAHPWLLALLILAAAGYVLLVARSGRGGAARPPRRAAPRGIVAPRSFPVSQSPAADDRRVVRLLAENDQLRAALRDAEMARDAAWDASASRSPRPQIGNAIADLGRAEPDDATQLLSDSTVRFDPRRPPKSDSESDTGADDATRLLAPVDDRGCCGGWTPEDGCRWHTGRPAMSLAARLLDDPRAGVRPLFPRDRQ